MEIKNLHLQIKDKNEKFKLILIYTQFNRSANQQVTNFQCVNQKFKAKITVLKFNYCFLNINRNQVKKQEIENKKINHHYSKDLHLELEKIKQNQ